MLFFVLFSFVSVTQVSSQVLRATACEWSRPDGRTLSCRTGHVLEISSAVYGRVSMNICKRGSAWGRANCRNPSSFEKTKQLCNGKQKCYLRASNSMFGDPCWGVNKYLDVKYACVKDTRLAPRGTTLHICEHERPDGRHLSCPQAYQKLNIVSALYGRKSLSLCAQGRHWGFNTCGTRASFVKAKQVCNGKTECYLRASNSMFGDPCKGVEKYLDVTYECVGIDPDVLPGFVGEWELEYSNKHEDAYTVSADGNVTLRSSRRTAFLQDSDNQKDFPSSQGWLKLNKIYRDAAWEYIRLKDDGTLEIRHFCTDGCAGKYKNSTHYCCRGDGMKKGGDVAYSYSTQTYHVFIKTSKKLYAGTNAKVFVIIYGEGGDTGKLFFGRSETNANAFQRNQVDKFTLHATNVGRITMMRIGHDNSGRSAAWHLDKVFVKVGSCTSTFSVWKWLYSSRKEIDIYPTLEEGNCQNLQYSNLNHPTTGPKGGDNGGANPATTPARSTGSICRRDYRKVGCYSRDWLKVPDLLITDLDPTQTKAFTTHMNWDDYAEGLHSLACRCRAKAAAGKYKYFGIGFLGECVAGKEHKSLEDMFKTKGEGEAHGCINGKWEKCNKKHATECTGNADYDFFYEIVV